MGERALQEIDLNLTPDDIPCSSVENVDDIRQVDDTTAKILAQMQKAKPARIKERPRRKVSFVILLSQAGAARRNILCFQYRFQFFFFCLFVCFSRVKAFNSIPYYRDRVYDPDPERSYTKAKLEKLKRSNATVESAAKQTSPNNSPFDSFPPDESTQFSNRLKFW